MFWFTFIKVQYKTQLQNDMREILNLDRKTKESIILLQIGTFLEYFDLMLFVHMAVVLNELFFPKSDPFTTSLITAFSFCSTFIFKPVGALLFGYIGAKIGRQHTVVYLCSNWYNCLLGYNNL